VKGREPTSKNARFGETLGTNNDLGIGNCLEQKISMGREKVAVSLPDMCFALVCEFYVGAQVCGVHSLHQGRGVEVGLCMGSRIRGGLAGRLGKWQ
jgi:hypothetical protein